MTATDEDGPRSGTFESLAVPAYRTLWTLSLGVFVAVTSQMVARGWVAYDLTGSNTGLGGVMVGFGLAMLIATPWGGVIADRYSKRAVIGWCTLALLLTSAWIGLAIVSGWIAYWMLVVASAIQAASFACYGPARMALTAELVDAKRLNNAIVLTQVSMESTRVIGPAAAGVLIGIAWFGPGGVFLAGASLCAGSLAFTLRLPDPPPRPTGVQPSALAALAEAVRYLRNDARLLLLALTSLVVVVAGMPYLTFLPVLAEEVHGAGAAGYGTMSAVSAAGAVVAGLASARATERSAWRRVGAAGAIFGAGLIAAAAAPTFALVLVALVFVGGGALMFQSSSQATLIGLSEPRYHGRVQSTVMIGYSGFGLMALPLGMTADVIGLPTTMVAMGVVILTAIGCFGITHRILSSRRAAVELAVKLPEN